MPMKFCLGYRHLEAGWWGCWLEKLGRPQICAAVSITKWVETRGPLTVCRCQDRKGSGTLHSGAFVTAPKVGIAQSSWKAKTISWPQRQKQLLPDPQATPEALHPIASLKSTGSFSVLLSPGQAVLWAFLFFQGAHVYSFIWTKHYPYILNMVWSLN